MLNKKWAVLWLIIFGLLFGLYGVDMPIQAQMDCRDSAGAPIECPEEEEENEGEPTVEDVIRRDLEDQIGVVNTNTTGSLAGVMLTAADQFGVRIDPSQIVFATGNNSMGINAPIVGFDEVDPDTFDEPLDLALIYLALPENDSNLPDGFYRVQLTRFEGEQAHLEFVDSDGQTAASFDAPFDIVESPNPDRGGSVNITIHKGGTSCFCVDWHGRLVSFNACIVWKSKG